MKFSSPPVTIVAAEAVSGSGKVILRVRSDPF
jgi:hypothetical protein